METTKELLAQLQGRLVDKYSEQLATLPMKKNTRECLTDGFRDGCRSGIHHVCEMLGVTVK